MGQRSSAVLTFVGLLAREHSPTKVSTAERLKTISEFSLCPNLAYSDLDGGDTTMAENPKPIEKRENKRRTQVKDLPKPEKELTPEEQKEIKGGVSFLCGSSISGETNTDAMNPSESQ